MESESPFFDIPQSEWIAANRSAFAIWDAYPVSPGHALVVSRRLITDWWEATPGERVDIFELVDVVRDKIAAIHAPDGFNVGFNAGAAAGQTVDHLHVHVIPRFTGDLPDPRGGIRNVIVARGTYLADLPAAASSNDPVPTPVTPVLVDGQVRLMLTELVQHIRHAQFDRIDIAVSFIKMSGLRLLTDALDDVLARGVHLRILTTDYLGLTEVEALTRLRDLIDDYSDTVNVRVFQDPELSFHPKAYLFYSADGHAEAAFVGSSNLKQISARWRHRVESAHRLHQRAATPVPGFVGRPPQPCAHRPANHRIRTRAPVRSAGGRGHRAS